MISVTPPHSFQFTKTLAHQKLQQLKETQLSTTANTIEYETSPLRFENLGFYVDFSRHHLSDDIIKQLLNLAKESPLEKNIQALFRGDKVNVTENRPALHTALRAHGSQALGLTNHPIHQHVADALSKMRDFCEAIFNQKHTGVDGSIITDVVHIGIGGSHLGPEFVSDALQHEHLGKVDVHFWSAVDNYPTTLHPLLQTLTPQSTLFILASKSFTTKELMINMALAKQWFIQHGIDEKGMSKHFVALTSNITAATDLGVKPEYIFPLWDWVGGRYSVWSAIGLPIMLNIGYDNFIKLLDGAWEMDNHFFHTPWHENLPILMALIGIWHINYMQKNTHAIITYHSALEQLSDYLQQLEMESNGKSVNLDNHPIDYQTVPVIWGGSGIKGQHSYYQLLHQGTLSCPIDFIGVAHEPSNQQENNFLLSNLLAQAYVLDKDKQVPNAHQCLEGDRPSTLILMQKITPEAIGRLLALYEHKVFVQGVIWHINSYDQWGVEEGKVIAKKWEKLFENNYEHTIDLDSTTNHAVQFIKQSRTHT